MIKELKIIKLKLIKTILESNSKYDIKIDGVENIPSSPVIYASNYQKSNVLEIFLEINGVIFYNINSKESRMSAKIEMPKALKKGKSINVYHEIVYNDSTNKLYFPFSIEMIDMAKRMGVPIIPVVQEYTYDDNVLDGKTHIKSVHIRFGKAICVLPENNLISKLEEFDAEFSTIKWQLIEEKGVFLRNKLYTNYIRKKY